MSNKTPPSGKPKKQPFDKDHPYHPDYTGDNPRGILDKVAAETPGWAPTAKKQRQQDQPTEQKLNE
jgi:hypothetical protein